MAIDTDVLFGTIEELGAGLRKGEYSSRELAEAYIDRLREVGPDLNAVVTITEERALEAADRADRELDDGEDRGPLHGIPYGAKDLLAAESYPTTWGAEPYRDQAFEEDAAVVDLLDDAGAVLIAKLAMVELAGGLGYEQADASFTGPTRNAWNTSAWTCGSSSGPGAAVPAGLVGFAIGSETFGSILCPASFSGISGLRPTYGRVSLDGAMALSWTMDKLGPMCRSATGCELVLGEIASATPAGIPPIEAEPDLDREDLHLAVIEGVGEEEQEGVQENYRESLSVLDDVASIETIALPDLPAGSVAGIVIDAEAAAAFDDLVDSGRTSELTAPADRVGGYSQRVVLAKDYINAMRVRAKIQRAMDELLEPFDAVVTPTRNSVASPISGSFVEYFGRFGGPSIESFANVCGLPGVSVPNGFAERGLPTGLAFTARAGNDREVLAVASEYQQLAGRPDYTELIDVSA